MVPEVDSLVINLFDFFPLPYSSWGIVVPCFTSFFQLLDLHIYCLHLRHQVGYCCNFFIIFDCVLMMSLYSASLVVILIRELSEAIEATAFVLEALHLLNVSL